MRAACLLLSLSLALSACGANDAIKATKGMPARMQEMSEKLDRTETALGRVFSFEALLKPEYGKVLSPVPFDLIPFAREFAKYAPSGELVEVVYLWVRKINETTLDLPAPTPDDVFQFDWRKMHVQAALQAVAGEIPRKKIDKIIREQIYSSGRYSDAALNLLMLRTRYLRDVMLDASILSESMNDVGDLEKAVEYAEELEFLARLRFAPLIGIELTGFKNNDLDVHEQFQSLTALKVWQRIKTKADVLSSKVKLKDVSSTPGENQKLFVSNKAKFDRAFATVMERIRGWGVQP